MSSLHCEWLVKIDDLVNKWAFLLVIGNAFCCLFLTSNLLHRLLYFQASIKCNIKLFPRNIMAISKQPLGNIAKRFSILNWN